MKVNRWATLGAGCLVQASSGLNYSFSILAPSFKDLLGFSDSQLALVAGSINIGGYFAVLSGWGYEKLQHRHNLGPRVIIWVGCVLMTLGYGGMWLQAAGWVPASLGLMIACGVISGNAGCWWDTSVLVTNVKNFPDDRGSVLGILKAFLGLSTSIYASMYWAMFASPSASSAGGGGSHNNLDDSMTEHIRTSQGWWTWLTPGAAAVDPRNAAANSGALVFLAVLATAPSLLNLFGSLFINQVPLEYYREHEGLLTPPPEFSHQPAAAADDATTSTKAEQSVPLDSILEQTAPLTIALPAPVPPPLPVAIPIPIAAPAPLHARRPRHVDKESRFLGLYFLIAVVAILQAGSTLAGHIVPGSEMQKLHAVILLALLCLLLLLPMSAGPLLRQSLRHSRTIQDQPTTRQPEHRVPLLIGYDEEAASEQEGHIGNGAQAAASKQPAPDPRAASTATEARPSWQSRPSPTPGSLTWGGGLESGAEEEEEEEAEDVDEEEAPPVQNLTAGMAVREATFWALFLALLSSCASGLTLLNNLAPLVISLGGKKGGQVAFVSLFSVGSASGRLLLGHLSEHYLHRMGLPRPIFVILTTALMTLCMGVLAAGPTLHMLYALSLLVGVGFGGHWSCIPAVATDLYGLGSFASIYCLLQCAPAAGVVYFASYLAGRNIADAARAQGVDDCMGRECFAGTWRALLLLDVVTLGVCIWLWRRTRGAYQGSHAAAAEAKEEIRVLSRKE